VKVPPIYTREKDKKKSRKEKQSCSDARKMTSRSLLAEYLQRPEIGLRKKTQKPTNAILLSRESEERKAGKRLAVCKEEQSRKTKR
jgi:hypothetical protein